MRKLFIVLVTAIGLQGCGSIKLGNVSFKAKEICSEEYADPLRTGSGCLPPARASNIQSYYYMNKPRLLISGDDANFLDMHVQIRESKINKVKLAVDKASAVGDMASANSHAKSVENALYNAMHTLNSGVANPNLLPSLIGRVFVVNVVESPSVDHTFKMPGNEGNPGQSH